MKTKKITLPDSKTEIEIKGYVNAGLMIDLAGFEGNQQEFLIKNMVMSVDGETEKIYEKVRELSLRDFKCLDDELKNLFEDVTEELSKNL